MKLLDLVPTSWLMPAAGALVLVLLAALGVQTARLHAEQTARAEERAAMAEERLHALRASAADNERERDTEQRRFAAVQERADAAENNAAAARADAAAAGDAARRLLQRADATAAAAREASRNPQASQAGPAAGDAIGMLTEVLGRCVARLQFVAELADQRGGAGQLCEQSYDALIESER